MLQVKGKLQKMWEEEQVDGRSFLRKLCQDAWKLDAMPVELVRRMLWLPRRQSVIYSRTQELGAGGKRGRQSDGSPMGQGDEEGG